MSIAPHTSIEAVVDAKPLGDFQDRTHAWTSVEKHRRHRSKRNLLRQAHTLQTKCKRHVGAALWTKGSHHMSRKEGVRSDEMERIKEKNGGLFCDGHATWPQVAGTEGRS